VREGLRRCLLAHNPDYMRRRDKAGARKSLQDGTGTEEMITVAMRSIDRRQVLAARPDSIHQGVFLLDRDERVDEDGVPPAIDEGRRYRGTVKTCWVTEFHFTRSRLRCSMHRSSK